MSKSSYRQILKTTSLFGGVQVIQIIIQIIRSKFVAVLLGPAGMGIVGLLNQNISVITSLTSFGLGTSAVKYVSEANAQNNNNDILLISGVLKKLVWLTGLLGLGITLVLSPILSEITFGNSDYTFAFILLSSVLLINQLSLEKRVLLQGLRRITDLAKANVWGSFVGLLTTIPIYYFYGIQGIVPVLIIGALVSLFFSWIYVQKLVLTNTSVSVNIEDVLTLGKKILLLGFALSINALLGSLVAYILRIFISNTGSIEDVGLYSAGFSIIGTYVGLVFTAMGTDYYPRLSAVANDPEQANLLINQQTEIAILILIPLLLFFIVFVKVVVLLLYSAEFYSVVPMVHWAAVGIFFKAISWAISYLFLAKGNSRLFFWNEVAAKGYFLPFNIVFYYRWGLEGLGSSFLLGYLFYCLQSYWLAHKKYDFKFSSGLIKVIVFQLPILILVFSLSFFLNEHWNYWVGSVFICFSIIYSYKELDARVDIKSLLKKFKKTNECKEG